MGVKKSNLLLWVATTLEILSRGRGTKKVKNRCNTGYTSRGYPCDIGCPVGALTSGRCLVAVAFAKDRLLQQLRLDASAAIDAEHSNRCHGNES